jgi:aspartate aminotransferase
VAFDCRDEVKAMHAAFLRRRDALAAGLADVPGLRFDVPDGAFYQMLDCHDLVDPARRQDGCWRLARHLLAEQKLATIPGEPFGANGCLRLSFARSEAELREGAERLRAGLRSFPG